jgi:hypothetical protein
MMTGNRPRYTRAENRDQRTPISGRTCSVKIPSVYRIPKVSKIAVKVLKVHTCIFVRHMQCAMRPSEREASKTQGHVMDACVKPGPHSGPNEPLNLNNIGRSNGADMSRPAMVHHWYFARESTPTFINGIGLLVLRARNKRMV